MKKKLFLIITALALCLSSVFSAAAVSSELPESRLLPRLVDEGDLLFSSEESEILAKLDEISERQKCDVVIVTAETLGYKTATEYADDFYDYNGYGAGANKDGILLLVCLEERDWAISTCGYGITAFTDAGQEYMVDKFKPYLSDGDYYEAFDKFATLCDDFLTQAKTGKPYDTNNMPKEFPFFGLILCIVGSIVVAFFIVTSMKSKLKSVKSKADANTYVRQGSMNLLENRDIFLYTTTNRTKRQTQSSSGSSSGSSTHTSSSGRSHGGSSGKF